MSLSTAASVPKWQQDEACLECNSCHKPFSFTNRKHHCRLCGLIFHEACCAPERVSLPQRFGFSSPQRLCHDCYALLIAARSPLNEDIMALQLLTRSSQLSFSSVLVRVEEFMPLVSVQFVLSLSLSLSLLRASFTSHAHTNHVLSSSSFT